jgi:hypothetical protein
VVDFLAVQVHFLVGLEHFPAGLAVFLVGLVVFLVGLVVFLVAAIGWRAFFNNSIPTRMGRSTPVKCNRSGREPAWSKA